VIQVDKVSEGGGEVIRLRVANKVIGQPAYFTAAYWVDGLLIDTGCAHTSRQLSEAVKDWHIAQVVNTHSHEDHIGANAAVAAMSGCKILAHPLALPILANPKLQPLQPYRRLFWGWPQPSQGEAIGKVVRTEHHCFQVIPTPGHSPDHICLFEPEQGWLFTGDSYIGGRDQALRQGYDIQGIIASLSRMAELPVQSIYSGSGSVRSAGVEPLLEKIAYLQELGAQVQALHEQGLSARQIRRRLLGPNMPITYITLGHFSAMHLIRSYLSGLGAVPEGGQVDISPPEEEVM
jgi:glyoxylase-like metal-dependent hydrolase (beta-lactamase superfamily II)